MKAKMSCIVAAQLAAGQVADVAGAHGLDQAQQMPPTIAPPRLPMPPRTPPR